MTTARLAYEAILIELNKENAPNLLLEDFNYLFNKAIYQYTNKRYNIYDINLQTTDDLRVLKATALLPVTKAYPKYEGTSLITDSNPTDEIFGFLGATYEAILPSDYYHILNCICIYKVNKTFKCYNAGDYWRRAATRLTADLYSQVLDNFYVRPTYKRPYYYIHNVNQLTENPTNSYSENWTGSTDARNIEKLATSEDGYTEEIVETYKYKYNLLSSSIDLYYHWANYIDSFTDNKANDGKIIVRETYSTGGNAYEVATDSPEDNNVSIVNIAQISSPGNVFNLLFRPQLEAIYRYISTGTTKLGDNLFIKLDTTKQYTVEELTTKLRSAINNGLNLDTFISQNFNLVVYKDTIKIPNEATEVTDYNGNNIVLAKGLPSSINLKTATEELQASNVERSANIRYGNKSLVRLEIRYGSDDSLFTLEKVYVDYLKTPLNIRLTQALLDKTEDTSLILEFPDYVCQEIINELVHIIMENISDLRILTHPVVSLSIANPAQALTEPVALSQ